MRFIKKFKVIELLLIMSIVLILASFMGDMKYWYIILIVIFVYYFSTHEFLSAAVNYPTEENKDKSDLCNWRLWLWILILGVGVVGMIFCFATGNWKLFFVWLLLGLFCCYRLSKFFKVDNYPEQNTEDLSYVQESSEIRKKNELIVVLLCVGCVIFILIWMMSQL